MTCFGHAHGYRAASIEKFEPWCVHQELAGIVLTFYVLAFYVRFGRRRTCELGMAVLLWSRWTCW